MVPEFVTTLCFALSEDGHQLHYAFIGKAGQLMNEGKAQVDQPLDSVILTLLRQWPANCFNGVSIVLPKKSYDQSPGYFDLPALIEATYRVPCLISPAAHALALCEMYYGKARGIKDFLFIRLGQEMLGAVVAKGKLISGQYGLAGALGDTIVKVKTQVNHPSRMQGPLSEFCSNAGICETARLFYAGSPSANETRKEKLCLQKLYTAAQQKDATACAVLAYTGQVLGESLANFIMISSPQVIILSGEITRTGDVFLGPTRFHMEQHVLPIYQNKVTIQVSSFDYTVALLYGAAVSLQFRRTD